MTQPALKQDVALRDEAPLPATETGAVLSMIAHAARDPACDIDKMERLMALQERMRRDEAEKQFNAAMSACQAAMPRVLRAATNSHNHSRYAKLEQIAKVAAPIYTKHGFSLSFDTEQGAPAGYVRMICKVAHAAGFSRDVRADLPLDAAGSQGKANKTGIQAWGSTMSYGRRYLTLLVFNIALTDEDNDGQPVGEGSVEFITDEQADELRDLVKSTGADIGKFLAFLQVESIPDIPADYFEGAKRKLLRKSQAGQGGNADA